MLTSEMPVRWFNQRFFALLTGISLLLFLTSCAKENPPQSFANYTSVDNGDYVSIKIDDKNFVPFAAVSNSDRGAQIGIVDNDEKDKVYEYKDFPSDEWVINFYDSGLMDGSMLMKEEHVSDIPDDLQSEYEWNQAAAEEVPETANQEEPELTGDYPPMVMVNDVVYQDTGFNSSAVSCGTMDGEITSAVDGSEIPTENNQSNFGISYGYQYSSKDQLIVVINDEWRIFRDVNSADTSIPEEVLNFTAEIIEVRDDSILVSVLEMPDLFFLKKGNYVIYKDNLDCEAQKGDHIKVWCDSYVEETDPPILPSVYKIEK